MKDAIIEKLGAADAALLFKNCTVRNARDSALLTSDRKVATQTLHAEDFGLVRALQLGQQSFLITDPTLTDNPIVFVSSGFIELTGYSIDQVSSNTHITPNCPRIHVFGLSATL